MSDEFDFSSDECNNWNYNKYIKKPNATPNYLLHIRNTLGTH